MAVTYSAVEVLVSVHQALLDEIDGGTGAGKIKLRDSGDTLLQVATLTDPAGSVNGTTGQLTLTVDSSANAVANGTADYGEITDSDDNVLATIDVIQGTSASSGNIVLNTLTIIAGTPVNYATLTIG